MHTTDILIKFWSLIKFINPARVYEDNCTKYEGFKQEGKLVSCFVLVMVMLGPSCSLLSSCSFLSSCLCSQLKVIVQVGRVARVCYDCFTQPTNDLFLVSYCAGSISWKTEVLPNFTLGLGDGINDFLELGEHLALRSYLNSHFFGHTLGVILINYCHDTYRLCHVIISHIQCVMIIVASLAISCFHSPHLHCLDPFSFLQQWVFYHQTCYQGCSLLMYSCELQ